MIILKNIYIVVKTYILYKIENERLFIKNISTLDKLFLFYYFLFILLLLSTDLVTYEKCLYFVSLWALLLSYKMIGDIIYYLGDNKDFKVLIQKNNNIFEKILNILLFIQKWKNPIILILLYIDETFYKLLRILIYKLRKHVLYSYEDYKMQYITYIQYFIFNIFLGPLKIILGFYYNMLSNLMQMPFFLFLLIRSFGLVLNILIISHITRFLFNLFGIKIYIVIYIFLIFLSTFIRIIKKDLKYFSIVKHINTFSSADYLVSLRTTGTILGLIIMALSINISNKISIKKIEIISSIYKPLIEEGFEKFWIFYKKNWLLYIRDIWKEIINRPSNYVYFTIVYWIMKPVLSMYDSNIPASIPNILYLRYNIKKNDLDLNTPTFIANTMYLKYKIKKLNLKIPEYIQKKIDFLYDADCLRLKLLLFMIWDIDKYIGNNNNFITFINRNNMYYIGCDDKIFDFSDLNNFKIENNKEDLPFYDPEQNMEFFNRLYKIIAIAPFNEDPLKNMFKSPILSNYLSVKGTLLKDLIGFYSDDPLAGIALENYTWIRTGESDDPKDKNAISSIEKDIKDWIILYLKERREEWTLSLSKETIEERNWRLLKETEYFLSNFK